MSAVSQKQTLGFAELRSKEQENANDRQCTQIRSKPVLLPIINCRSFSSRLYQPASIAGYSLLLPKHVFYLRLFAFICVFFFF
jgi:hypothetical protein